MQGKIKFTFIGMDSFVGKKDATKTYYNVSLLQGSDVAKVFLEKGQEELFKEMPKYTDILCDCSWRLDEDKYGFKITYRLHSIEELQLDVPDDFKKVTDISAAGKKEKTA